MLCLLKELHVYELHIFPNWQQSIKIELNVIGLYHTGLETQLSTQEASKSFVEIKLQSCESLLSQTQDKVKSLESEQQKLLSEKKEMVDTEKDLTTKLKEANKQVSETCL